MTAARGPAGSPGDFASEGDGDGSKVLVLDSNVAGWQASGRSTCVQRRPAGDAGDTRT